MRRLATGILCAALAGAAATATTLASHDLFFWKPRPQLLKRLFSRERSFQRVGTFANYRNNPSRASETVSEIVAATADGRMLIYTDSPMGAIGVVDINDPSNPLPAGKLTFRDGDEPTSVDVLGNRYALVAVNSSESYANPSGYLAVVDLTTGPPTVVREIDLGGQPDSIKISPDHRFAAIAIENERDEDVNDGELPQLPAGYLAVIRLVTPDPASWTRSDVAMTGYAQYAPEDPEPEFVDINEANQAVVSLQENNHLVIVDLETGRVLRHFPAGVVTLHGVDATGDDLIALDDTLSDVPREPDAVAWVPGPGGRDYVATANEGDLFGGSRGFSIFRTNGTIAFDSGTDYEELAVQHGHYPEGRSDAKGTEPEGVEYGRYGRDDFLFVGSERAGFVAVYALDHAGRPSFHQLLPAPLRPEGLLAIPGRNLFVASGEEDDPSLGVRSSLMIYRLDRGEPDYPQILSDDDHGSPIPWGALSGLTSVPGQWNTLLAVWDSAFAESRIFRIDVSAKPAVITDAITITGGSGHYDPEGIAVAPDHTLWVASEGNASDSRPNRLLQTDASGHVLAEVGLPAEILACRAASTARGTLGSGFEGLAILRGGRGQCRLIVAQQRGWDYTTPECEDLDDDDGGLNAAGEPNRSRLWIYDPADGSWDHIAWELAPKPAEASWVGLSEITETHRGEYIVIERDNRTGDFAELKTLVLFDGSDVADRIVRQSEKQVYDLLPALKATHGWITDKPEGVGVMLDGRTFVVTDNDGVDGWSGETWFLRLGPYRWLFR